MTALAAVLLLVSLLPHWIPEGQAKPATLVAIAVWGFASWAFFPAQQARLIGIVGAGAAPVILSLNASCLYLGFSIGAVAGAVVLTVGSVTDLGWVSAGFVLASFALLCLGRRGRSRQRMADPQ